MQASGGPPGKPRANPRPSGPDLHFEPSGSSPQFVDVRFESINRFELD